VQIMIPDRCPGDEFRSTEDLLEWARVLWSGVVEVIRDAPEHVAPSARGKNGQLPPKFAEVARLLVNTTGEKR